MSARTRILLVEDEAITALDLGQTLELLGYEVGRIVATGEDAIAAAAESSFDLVLSDIVLRGEMDGVDASIVIRRNSHVPVVFLTAYGDWQTLARARDAEPYGYLIKPFHAEALRATVETALRRAELERSLTQRELELHTLATQLMVVRDEERAKLARDIHDDLGQSLTLLRLGVSWAKEQTNAEMGELGERLREISRTVDDAIACARRLVAGLHPPILDHATVSEALQWQCRDFSKRTGIAAEFEAGLPPERDGAVDRDGRTALFRMLQEALTNVVRHAKATQVHVSLRVEADQLKLEIRDNGVGIRTTDPAPGSHYGLIGLRERARSLGGSAAIQSIEGSSGTEVLIRVPLDSNTGGNSQ